MKLLAVPLTSLQSTSTISSALEPFVRLCSSFVLMLYFAAVYISFLCLGSACKCPAMHLTTITCVSVIDGTGAGVVHAPFIGTQSMHAQSASSHLVALLSGDCRMVRSHPRWPRLVLTGWDACSVFEKRWSITCAFHSPCIDRSDMAQVFHGPEGFLAVNYSVDF